MRITNEILGVYRVDTENVVLEGLLFCLFQIAEFAQPYMMSTPDSLSWPPQNPLSYFPFLSSGESQQRNLLWALLLWRIENRLRVWKEKVNIQVQIVYFVWLKVSCCCCFVFFIFLLVSSISTQIFCNCTKLTPDILHSSD